MGSYMATGTASVMATEMATVIYQGTDYYRWLLIQLPFRQWQNLLKLLTFTQDLTPWGRLHLGELQMFLLPYIARDDPHLILDFWTTIGRIFKPQLQERHIPGGSIQTIHTAGDSGCYTLNHQVCQQLWHQTVDQVFSWQLPVCVQAVPDPQALDVDALTISWKGLDTYAYPLPSNTLSLVTAEVKEGSWYHVSWTGSS